jgi:hypothetical protein
MVEASLQMPARCRIFAQGWIDSFSPPDSMRQIIGQLRHYTREARGTDAPIT